MLAIQKYSIAYLQDEVRALVARGSLDRQQCIGELRKYFGDGEWPNIERILIENDYLSRDRIIDLVGKESWENDD